MDTLWLDFRHALRGLARSPGFTAVTVLTLALGIGATTGMFSVLHAVLLASLPYPAPEELVLGRRTQDGRVGFWVSMLDYLDYRDQATSFVSLAASPGGSFKVASTGGDRPERIDAQMVSYNLFSTLGVAPVLGRTFTAQDGLPDQGGSASGQAPAAFPEVGIVSYGFWHRRLGGSPEALGRTLTLAGRPVTVVGVMPEGFKYLDEADVWVPMRQGPGEARRFHNWLLVGRLKPGVDLEAAQAEIDAISTRLGELYPDSNRGKGLNLAPLREALVETLRPQVLIIMAAVALMLLIASGNVANLLLARGVTRRSELAMRVALGASRARLVRQLVTEAMALALLGGSAGLVVAAALQRVLPTLLDLDSLTVPALRLDPRVLAFALAVSLLTGVLIGVVPAFRSSGIAPFEELKGAARTVTSRAGARLRMGLVAGQVTLSLVLLIGSSLLIRSYAKLVRADLGFDPENVLTASFVLPPQQYGTEEARIRFFEDLLAEVRALPGVTSAGMIDRLPIASPGGDIYVWTPDKPPERRGLGQTALYRRVLPGYLEAMRMPLVAGRDIEPSDRAGAPPVMVVNQAMAGTLFRDASPLGRQVVVDVPGVDEPVTFEVVGVVADARVSSVRAAPYPTMYHSFAQFPRFNLSLVVRSSAEEQGLTRALRQLVWQRDKDIPVEELARMTSTIRTSTLAQQTLAGTVTSFSLLALLLAAVGLFGVLAYQVMERQHELGIRMALGAGQRQVLATVLGQGLAVTGVGLVVGLAAGLALTRLMSSLLYEVAATDPASFLAAAACLVVVALAACLVPAMRALRVQPVRALRYE